MLQDLHIVLLVTKFGGLVDNMNKNIHTCSTTSPLLSRLKWRNCL